MPKQRPASARPDIVPRLKLNHQRGNTLPSDASRNGNDRVETSSVLMPVRPSTAPASIQIAQGHRIDSFAKCETSFRCPVCSQRFVLDEKLRNGMVRDMLHSRPVAAVGMQYLTRCGAVHPTRLVFLEARKRFYREHVFNCRTVWTLAEKKKKQREGAAAEEALKTGYRRDFDASMESQDEDLLGCLADSQRALFSGWVLAQAGNTLTSARLRSFQGQIPGMQTTAGGGDPWALDSPNPRHSPKIALPFGRAMSHASSVERVPSSMQRSSSLGQAREMAKGDHVTTPTPRSESKRLGGPMLLAQGALSRESAELLAFKNSNRLNHSVRQRPSTAPAQRRASGSAASHAALSPRTPAEVGYRSKRPERLARCSPPSSPAPCFLSGPNSLSARPATAMDWHVMYHVRICVRAGGGGVGKTRHIALKNPPRTPRSPGPQSVRFAD